VTQVSDEREERIREIMKPLEKADVKDIAVRLSRGTVGLVPYGGSLIAEVIGIIAPDFQMKRLRRFVAELAEDLERLKTKIDSQYVRTEEFVHIFQKTFRGVASNYQKEKLDALRAVLLNSCIDRTTKEDLKEYISSLALQLNALHIRVIAVLRDPQRHYSSRGIRDDREMMGIGGSMIESLRQCLPDIPEEYLRSAWNDLYNWNLVKQEARSLGVMISGKGSRALESCLSELGNRLSAYITSPLH
jgi:hypothetical protein